MDTVKLHDSSASKSSPALIATCILGLGTAAAFIYGIFVDDAALQLWTKPWPVLVLAWLVHRCLRSEDAYAGHIRSGLLASVVGDICLEFEAGFLPGMGAFLIAHVFYLLAYAARDKTPRYLLAVPFGLWAVVVLGGLQSGLRDAGMLIPVGVYTLVICTMLWRAWARIRGGVSMDVWIAAVGATLFAVSDTMIAVSMFGPGFSGADYWIIVLYWLGQSGIAYSTFSRPTPDWQAG